MKLLRAALAIATAATLGAPTHVVGAQAPVGSTTIILVRHAEKAAEPAADPPLTAAGTARAEALVDVLKDAGVKAIVSTQFVRTRATAAPAATKLGIVPEIADARGPDHVRALTDSLLARHRGETILVVGHSNTVPAIIAALGAPAPAPICDAEYDNLYVVVVPPAGKASVTHAHYGAASPPDTSCRRM